MSIEVTVPDADSNDEVVVVVPKKKKAGGGRKPRFTRYAFTVNTSQNENGELMDDEEHHWYPPVENSDERVRYIVCGLEICPDTGRIHWQCYIELYEKSTLDMVKRIIECPWAHIEICLGDPTSNIIYCTAEALDVVQWGISARGAGFRSDLARVAKSIREGATELEVWRQHPCEYLKFHGGFGKAIAMEEADREHPFRDIQVICLWGDTNGGKTHTCWEAEPRLYSKPLFPGDIKWWDNYTGQKCILLDDFYDQLNWNELKVLLDKYPVQVSRRTKSPVWAAWTKVYITSQHPIRDWCADPVLTNLRICRWGGKLSPKDLKAVTRRIGTELQFHDPEEDAV